MYLYMAFLLVLRQCCVRFILASYMYVGCKGHAWHG